MKYYEDGEWKDIQIKVANAIQNEYGESNNDGYSQNYLNDHTINVGVNSTNYPVNFIKGKNLSDGVNMGAWLNTAANSAGATTEGNTGLYIQVSGGKYTISTASSQTRYRVACFDSLPLTSQGQTAYNGVNKDGTSDTITIDTTGHNYLIINATDLSLIQIEKGETASTFEPYIDRAITVDNIAIYNQDLQNYSLGEKIIGTWIDGKPIYRKCFEKSSLTTGDNTITTGLTIDTLVRLDCNLYRTNGIWHTLTFANSSNLNAVMSITYQLGTISINIGSAITNASKCYVILEYTKTSGGQE